MIVQATGADTAAAVVGAVGGSLRRSFSIIDGVAADVPAAALDTLAGSAGVEAVSLDGRVIPSELAPVNPNLWQAAVGVSAIWGSDSQPAPPTPANAVIDSGVDASWADDLEPGCRIGRRRS